MKPLELIPPPDTSADRLADRLGALGRVRLEAARRVRSTLLDRTDGILREQGITLEWQATPEGHRLAWRDGPRNPVSIPFAAPPPRHVVQLPEGILRRRLQNSVGHGDLVEVASVRGSSRRVRLIDREEKTLCSVSVERASAVGPNGARPMRLQDRVRVIPVKGYEGLAKRIAAHLAEQPGWKVSPEGLYEEAMRRMGGDARSRLMARISDLLRSMEHHRRAIDPRGDPEELHDFRVCLRRVRTLFAQIEPSAASRAVALDLKWLGQVSGAARDLDVQAEDVRRTLRERCTHDGPAHARIEELIDEHRHEAHRGLADALASRRYARLLRAARDALRNEGARPGEPDGDRAPARPPLSAAKLYRKALRQGRGLGPRDPDERFHRLRKTLKKLRYLLEAGPARGDARRGDDALKSLKGMQTILGDLNDVSVQRELLEWLRRELGGEAPAGLHGCVDELVALAEDRRRALKTDFARHFGNLASSAALRSLLEAETGSKAAS